MRETGVAFWKLEEVSAVDGVCVCVCVRVCVCVCVRVVVFIGNVNMRRSTH